MRDAGLLHGPAVGRQRRQHLQERVDGVGGRHRLLGHLDGGRLGRRDRAGAGQVEDAGVVAAPGHRPAHGQHEGGGQGPGQPLVAEVLVEADQGVALQQEVLEPRAVGLHRGVVAVVGHRSRHVADPPAQQVEPPAEVDVLVEHEVPVVEPADRLVVLGPDEHRRPGGEQHVLGGVVLAGVRPLALPLVAHAVPGEGPVDVVDVVAVPVEDLAGHRGHVGLPLEHLDRGRDPVAGRAGVVVDEGEDLPRRLRRRRGCSRRRSRRWWATRRGSRRAPPSRMRAALPSPEALSTTISCSRSAGQSTSANDRRQVMVSSAPR